MDALLAVWEVINDPDQDPVPTEINGPDPSGEDPAPACKHKFLKVRNANIQCKTKVKGGGEYSSKHKK